jgi:hypothetical protein
MLILTGLLLVFVVGWSAPAEQQGQKLKALSEAEMIKLLPDPWPDDWHIFIQHIGNQTIEHCSFSERDNGGLVCVLLLQKGTATKYGMPTQQAKIKIHDVRDLSAEDQFTPKDMEHKKPDGTVLMTDKAITFNGHKAQLTKLLTMKDTIIIKYRSGRFEIEVQNMGGQGIGIDDLKVLCKALNLPK